jgi:hypothetical protein
MLRTRTIKPIMSEIYTMKNNMKSKKLKIKFERFNPHIMLNQPFEEIIIDHPSLGEVTLCPEMPLEYQSGAWAIASEYACSNCNLGKHCNENCEFYEYSLMKQLKGK